MAHSFALADETVKVTAPGRIRKGFVAHFWARDRAEAVARVLREQNIPDREILVVGKSWDEPIATNTTREGQARNRQVEVEVQPRDGNVTTHLVEEKSRDAAPMPEKKAGTKPEPKHQETPISLAMGPLPGPHLLALPGLHFEDSRRLKPLCGWVPGPLGSRARCRTRWNSAGR